MLLLKCANAPLLKLVFLNATVAHQQCSEPNYWEHYEYQSHCPHIVEVECGVKADLVKVQVDWLGDAPTKLVVVEFIHWQHVEPRDLKDVIEEKL
jgi:hypothetical protein